MEMKKAIFSVSDVESGFSEFAKAVVSTELIVFVAAAQILKGSTGSTVGCVTSVNKSYRGHQM